MTFWIIEEKTYPLVHGAEGYLVIDSLRRGTSSGGVRVSSDMTLEEVRALARDMSLKFGFFDLPRGGAKSGIRMPKGLDGKARMEVLEAFGEAISSHIRHGRYYPGMDMNCGPLDLQAIYRGAGIASGDGTDTSYYTALSAAHALMACRRELSSGGRPLLVALEGFGRVGAWLARRLPPEEFRFTAVSTVAGAIVRDEGFGADELYLHRQECGDLLVERLPGRRISHRDLLTLPVDILVPAARTWSIDSDIAARTGAACIVPVANAPYCPGSVSLLMGRGVLCLPGFVCNGGGVFGSSLADSGVPEDQIESVCEEAFQPAIRRLIRRSRELGISPVELAENIARRRLEKDDSGKTAGLLKRAYRRGLVPAKIYGFMVLHSFGRNFEQMDEWLDSLPAG